MNEENMKHWEQYADIDPKYTKAITGKSYKGTSPNPQYVIMCLTDMFGPVGVGFGWNVISEAFEPMGDEVLHWCRIRFWHTDKDSSFESYGQTKALMKTKNGLMLDEDAPKKSLTDAIIKSASHIGVASNIFLGRWDDQKYVQEVNTSFRKEEAAKIPEPSKNAVKAALAAIDSATSLKELQEAFMSLPAAVKKLPEVIAAKDQAKHDFQNNE